MAIDSRIALAGTPLNIGQRFGQNIQNLQQVDLLNQRRDLAPLQLQQAQRANELGIAQQPAQLQAAEFAASSESQQINRQEQVQQFATQSAQALKPLLDAGDVAGATRILQGMKSRAAELQLDTTELDNDINQLQTPQGLRSLIQETNSALGVQEAQPKIGRFRFIETPTGIATLDTTTGEQTEKILTSKQIDQARKDTAEQLKTDLKLEDTVFDRSKKIRDRHDKLSGEFVKVRDAFDRVRASEQTAAGDIALIFNYMKMLDPGSVVREGEFATAQNAGGVDDRIVNSYNKLLTGERLNPKQRLSFESQATKLFDKAESRNKSLIKETISIGDQFGVTADNIFGAQQPETSGFKILSIK